MTKTALVYSDKYLEHNTGEHPERKERLSSLIAYLKADSLMERLQAVAPRSAGAEEISLIHDPAYIDFVRDSCDRGVPSLDMDTVISPRSYEVAALAVGGVLAALDAVIAGEVDNAFCAVRPPGHHAEKDRGMGFCLFNNVAVAARYLQEKHGLKKIFIIDWDVHHGNGTEHVFYDDPSVFYASLHQYPHYPGTGRSGDRGDGAGLGATLNIPFAGGEGDQEYSEAFKEKIVPAAEHFLPDFILISAGFDAHQADFLSSMNITSQGFGQLTRIVRQLADKLCHGRIVSVLEGGYQLEAMSESAGCHLRELLNL
ncbi:MAG: histone deacetylase [bacterium]